MLTEPQIAIMQSIQKDLVLVQCPPSKQDLQCFGGMQCSAGSKVYTEEVCCVLSSFLGLNDRRVMRRVYTFVIRGC